MDWDEDPLEYGYLLRRLADGKWWHLHFGRAGSTYQCGLLGRRTDVFASVTLFGRGAQVESRFLLTLDGEGVESDDVDAAMDCDWGRRSAGSELTAEAEHFQREIMPVLYESVDFQRAVSEIVDHKNHIKVVPSGKLQRLHSIG